MRILADESVPRRFARSLSGHDVITVQEAGWASLSNGALIRAAEEGGFDALVTVDQSIPFQQNLSSARIGIVILAAKSNRFQDLQPLISATLRALATLHPGEIVHVAA